MENNTNVKKINTIQKNGNTINIYAKPWMYEGSREVYAATINTPAGYQKGTITWNNALADTIQRAMEFAFK